MFEFEDEVESSIDYVAREVRQEYLKSFEQDLKEATEQIQNLKQQLEAIISDDLRARHIESLKAESAQLEALVKSMVDKDRRVLKRIDIAKTHLNTESMHNIL